MSILNESVFPVEADAHLLGVDQRMEMPSDADH
jgi:hypothetical protein